MLSEKDDRMLLLLWLVAYCGDFPTQLASRIGGNADWNRHVMYRAIKEGYVSIVRGEYRQRVIRSMRITDAGLDYIIKADSDSVSLLFARQKAFKEVKRQSPKRILRIHTLATGLVMAYRAGATILPKEKPSLLSRSELNQFDLQKPYFYSIDEIREAILAFEPRAMIKSTRCIGVIVYAYRCFFLYYTGFARMYWMQSTEENFTACVEVILRNCGFHCTVPSQILIGSNMSVAVKSVKYSRISHGKERRYFRLSHEYNNCFYLLNNNEGDLILSILLDKDKQLEINKAALSDFKPPESASREVDAVTLDGRQPVILAYQCDLLAIMEIEREIDGFQDNPIVLCTDYQVNAIQSIVGPGVEVQAIPEGVFYEKAKQIDRLS